MSGTVMEAATLALCVKLLEFLIKVGNTKLACMTVLTLTIAAPPLPFLDHISPP
jgi:hypothetical protein